MNPSFFCHHFSKPDWEILGLSKEDFIKLLEWAFGAGWGHKTTGELAECWNDLHGDLFLIAGNERCEDSLKNIRDAWKAQL